MEKKLTEYLEIMAKKLGVAAEHLYEVLTKQAMVEGIIDLIFYPILFLIIFPIFIFCFKKYRYHEKECNWSEESNYMIASIISGVVAAALLIGVLATMPDSIGRIINPEYYAIQDLLDVLSGKDE
jgi:hypothetical protein